MAEVVFLLLWQHISSLVEVAGTNREVSVTDLDLPRHRRRQMVVSYAGEFHSRLRS